MTMDKPTPPGIRADALRPITTDRRRQPRLPRKQLVELQFSDPEEGPTPSSVWLKDLNLEGLSLFLEGSLPPHATPLYVRLYLPELQRLIEAPVEQIWTIAQTNPDATVCGFRFAHLKGYDFKILQRFLTQQIQDIPSRTPINRRKEELRRRLSVPSFPDLRISSRRLDLPTFTLLVDGKDLDTRKYEYFPYADKLITEFRKTREMIIRLKGGERPPGYQNYVFARYCIGLPDTNQRAMEAAHRASQNFREAPLAKRIKILKDIHDLLLRHREILIELMVIEGHPRRLAEWEFLGMERAYAEETLNFFKMQSMERAGESDGETVWLARKADGVVCISPPKNAASSNSLLGAFSLLGGNSIVIKPPLHSPLSTVFLWRNVIHTAVKINGAPENTINIIVGDSQKYMEEWLASPLVNDILYFGSSNQGLAIGSQIYQHGKKPILELSGNDVLVVWKDADIKSAIASLLDGFLGSMQICMVPKTALIHEAVYEQFEQRFLQAVSQLKAGLPSDPDTSLSPVIKIPEFFEFLEDAMQKGGAVLCGGKRINHRGDPDPRGLFLEPTVVRIVNDAGAMDYRCVKEETFFPLLPLVRVTSEPTDAQYRTASKDATIFAKMTRLVNANDYGLRVSVWVSSDTWIRRFIRSIENTGLLKINARHVDFSLYLSTHGGTRRSGGPLGEMNYVWQKTTHLQGISVRKPGRF